MNTKNIKEAVAKLGFQMRISHLRRLSKDAPIKAGHSINISHIKAFGLSNFVNCKGGVTLVKLIRDGKAVFGNAECSIHDSYNKNAGVKIATKRALEELNVPDAVIVDCIGA